MDVKTELTANFPRLLRLPAVMKMTGLSRTTLYSKMVIGEFPNRVVLGPKSVAWVAQEVSEWIENRPRGEVLNIGLDSDLDIPEPIPEKVGL